MLAGCNIILTFVSSKYHIMDNDYLKISDDGRVVLGFNEFEEPFCDLIIPDGIEEIGPNAFYGCSFLLQVVLPNSLKIIHEGAFDSTGLQCIQIPEGVETIGTRAFSNTSSLTDISLPNSLRTIETCALGASALKSIYIPEGVTTIGLGAFFNSVDLVCASIPSTVKKMCDPFVNPALRFIHMHHKDLSDVEIIMNPHSDNCLLFVPYGTKDLYQQHPNIRGFQYIIEENYDSYYWENVRQFLYGI